MMPQTVPNSPTKDVHDLLNALLNPLETDSRRAFLAAFPFPHGGHEQRRKSGMAFRTKRQIEVFKRLARPEGLLEAVIGGLGSTVRHDLFENDRP
jgi:hypothetical protein